MDVYTLVLALGFIIGVVAIVAIAHGDDKVVEQSVKGLIAMIKQLLK